MAAARNMLSGYAEPAHLNDFMFEQQRRTFSTFGKIIGNPLIRFLKCCPCIGCMTFFPLLIGYALDPSVDSNQISSNSFIGAVDEAEKNKGNLFYMIYNWPTVNTKRTHTVI